MDISAIRKTISASPCAEMEEYKVLKPAMMGIGQMEMDAVRLVT